METKKGRPRKYEYTGEKKISSIRLTDQEKQKILEKFASLQEFVQFCLKEVLK